MPGIEKNSTNNGNRAPPKRAKSANGSGCTPSQTAVAFAGCTAVETEVEDLTEEIEDTTTVDIINNDATNGEFQVQTFQSFNNNDIFQSLTIDSSEFTKPQGTLMDNYLTQCYLAHNTNYALGENSATKTD